MELHSPTQIDISKNLSFMAKFTELQVTGQRGPGSGGRDAMSTEQSKCTDQRMGEMAASPALSSGLLSQVWGCLAVPGVLTEASHLLCPSGRYSR